MLRRTLSFAALMVLAAPGAAHARTLVRVDKPTPVSASGSDVVYSRSDPATREFQLWYAHGRAVPIPLPIDERTVPFDADLGPGPHGHRVAVYSRCTSEPPYDTADENGWPIPYTRGRGCSPYEVDLFTNVERRLRASDAPGDEVLPPQYADGAPYWARLCQGDPAGCPGRAGLM
ncbi:hypothetical protein [Candidatus Solirubrobacter pratensis]|uniref:hypothetical protein n=1 Tax=Candidatus Solirubrobacter pratensis TaxID=1298857 RepID=UPI000408B183|nr:hypothetical protein [Candidatus Solirubrobacter pratensis]